MLSAVLRSDRAVQMSIAIVRTFVRMRELLMAANREIAARVEKLERSHDRTASVIEVLVEDVDRLAREVKDIKALPPVTKRRIGFNIDRSERRLNWRSQAVIAFAAVCASLMRLAVSRMPSGPRSRGLGRTIR
jgi:hypothetical protein